MLGAITFMEMSLSVLHFLARECYYGPAQLRACKYINIDTSNNTLFAISTLHKHIPI